LDEQSGNTLAIHDVCPRRGSLVTTQRPSRTLTVAVATPNDPELVEPIRAVAGGIEVLYEPDPLPPIRYPGDHRGVEWFCRDASAERRWQELPASAEMLFGLPGDSLSELAAVLRSNPRLRWVQGTAAGTGEQVKAAGLSEEELERVVITSASGVHVGPRAEFCLLGLLHFTMDVPRVAAAQRAHHWDHSPMPEMRESTLLVLGLGAIGTEVARLAKACRRSASTVAARATRRTSTRSTRPTIFTTFSREPRRWS
jgi:hypothetical protein